jgi:hypothetical protein
MALAFFMRELSLRLAIYSHQPRDFPLLTICPAEDFGFPNGLNHQGRSLLKSFPQIETGAS